MEEELDPLIVVEKLLEAYENAGLNADGACTLRPSLSIPGASPSDESGAELIRIAMEGLCLSLCLRGNEFRVCIPLEKLVELICMSQRFTNDINVLELAARALAIIADSIVKGAEVIASGMGGGMELILTLLGDLEYIVQHKMLMEEVLQCLCAVTPRLPSSSLAPLSNSPFSDGAPVSHSHLAFTCAMVRAALAHQIVRLQLHPTIQSSVPLSLQCLTALEGLLQGGDFGDASRELKQFWRGSLLRGFRECLDFYLPEQDAASRGGTERITEELPGQATTSSHAAYGSRPDNSYLGHRVYDGGVRQWNKEGCPLLLKYLTCFSCYCDRISTKQLKEEGEDVKNMWSEEHAVNSRRGHRSSLSDAFRRRFSFSLFGKPQRKSEHDEGGTLSDSGEDGADIPEERYFIWYLTSLCATTIRRSAIHLGGEAGDTLRSAACSPLLALYRSLPHMAVFLFERARVVEVICSVAVSLLEGVPNEEEGQQLMPISTPVPSAADSERERVPVTENETNSFRDPSFVDQRVTSENVGQNDSNSDNSSVDGNDNDGDSTPQDIGHIHPVDFEHQIPPTSRTIAHENGTTVPLIASELSVLPLLEFLLVVLPPPRSFLGHADFANTTVPFYMWIWEDQFSQPHSCGERLSVLLEIAYQSGRFESPQMLLPLYWRDIQERHHEDISNCRRPTVAGMEGVNPTAAMLGAVPCVLQRQSVLTGYIHGRLNGLRRKKKDLQCRCTRRFRLVNIEKQLNEHGHSTNEKSNVDNFFSRDGLPLGSALTAHAAASAADSASIQDDFWRLEGVSQAFNGNSSCPSAESNSEWSTIFEGGFHFSSAAERGVGKGEDTYDKRNMDDYYSPRIAAFSATSVNEDYMGDNENENDISCSSESTDEETDEDVDRSEKKRKGCCSLWGCCNDSDSDSLVGSAEKTIPKISFDYVTHSQLASYRSAMKTEEALKMVLTTCVPSLMLLVEKTVNPLVARHCAVLLLRTIALVSEATNPETSLFTNSYSSTEAEKLQPLSTHDEYCDHDVNSFMKSFQSTVGSGLSRKLNPIPDTNHARRRIETLFDAVESGILQTAIYLLKNPVEGSDASPVISVQERVSPFRAFDTIRQYREQLSNVKGISTRFKAVTFTFIAEMQLASADIILFLLRRNHQRLELLQQTDVSCHSERLVRRTDSKRVVGMTEKGVSTIDSNPNNDLISLPKPPLLVSSKKSNPIDGRGVQSKTNVGDTYNVDDLFQWVNSTSEDRDHVFSHATFVSLKDAIRTLIKGLQVHYQNIIQKSKSFFPDGHTPDSVLTSTEAHYTSSYDSPPVRLTKNQRQELVFYLPGPSCPFHGTPVSLIRRFIRVLQLLDYNLTIHMRDFPERPCPVGSPSDENSSLLLHNTSAKRISPPIGLKSGTPCLLVLSSTVKTIFQQEMERQVKMGTPYGLRAALALLSLIQPLTFDDMASPVHPDRTQTLKLRTTVSSRTCGLINGKTLSAVNKTLQDGTDRNPYTGPHEGCGSAFNKREWLSLERIAEYYPEALLQAANDLVKRGQCKLDHQTAQRRNSTASNDSSYPQNANDLTCLLSDVAPPLLKEERHYSAPLQSLLNDLTELLSAKLQFIAPDQGFTVLDGQPSRFTKRKRTERGRFKGIETATSTALYVRLSSLTTPEQYFKRFGIAVEEIPLPKTDCCASPTRCDGVRVEVCEEGDAKTEKPVFFAQAPENLNNSQSRLSERSCSSFRNNSHLRSSSPSPALTSAPVMFQINIRGYPLKYAVEGQPLTYLFLLLPRMTLASLAMCLCNRLNSRGTNPTTLNKQGKRRLHLKSQGGRVPTSIESPTDDNPSPRPLLTPRHILFLFGGCPVISPLSTLVDAITSVSPNGVREVFDFERVGQDMKKKRKNGQSIRRHEHQQKRGDNGPWEVTGINVKLHHISFLVLSEPMPWELYYDTPCGCRGHSLNNTLHQDINISDRSQHSANSATPTVAQRSARNMQIFCGPAHFFRQKDGGASNSAPQRKLNSLWSLMEALITTLRAHTTISASSFRPTASNASGRLTVGPSYNSGAGRVSTGINCRRIHSSLIHLLHRSNEIFIMPSLMYDFDPFAEHNFATGMITSDGVNVSSCTDPTEIVANPSYNDNFGGQIAMVALWTHPLVFSHEIRKEIFYVLMQCQRNNIFPRLQKKRQDDDDTDISLSTSVNAMNDRIPPAYAFQAQNLDWLLDEGVNVHTQRISVEVTRCPELVVPVGCSILQRYANCPLVLDFSYRGEPGIGLGPALEFFESFAKAIETDSSLGMWRTEEILDPGDFLYHVESTEAQKLNESSSNILCSETDPGGKAEVTDRGKQEEKKEEIPVTPLVPPVNSNTLSFMTTEGTTTEDSQISLMTPMVCRRKVIPLLFPSPNLSEAALSLFFSLGLFIGRLLYMKRTTLLRFHPLMLKVLRDNSLLASSYADASKYLEMVDPLLENSLRQLESMPADELSSLDLTFVLPGSENVNGKGGEELKPNGQFIHVRAHNVKEYTLCVRRFNLDVPLQKALLHLRNGLFTTIHPSHFFLFSVPELDVLVSGKRGKLWESPQDLAPSVIASHGYTLSSRIIQDFLDVVASWSATHQRLFLQFITGCSTLGSSGLQPPITIVRRDVGDGGTENVLNRLPEGVDLSSERRVMQEQVDGTLPSVSTCFHYLKLPQYSCRKVLEDRLLNAITDGQGSFDLS